MPVVDECVAMDELHPYSGLTAYIWGPTPPTHPPEEPLASVTAISPTDHQSPRPMQLEGLQTAGSCLKASTST